jgi:hypothetical protein
MSQGSPGHPFREQLICLAAEELAGDISWPPGGGRFSFLANQISASCTHWPEALISSSISDKQLQTLSHCDGSWTRCRGR